MWLSIGEAGVCGEVATLEVGVLGCGKVGVGEGLVAGEIGGLGLLLLIGDKED